MNRFLIVGFLVIAISLFSQERSPLFKSYQVAYFGKSGLHPGIKASGSLYSSVKTSQSERKFKSFDVSPALGAYYHKGNHLGLFVATEVSYRVAYKKGFTWEVYGGVGYLRTFLDGKTYEVTNQGEVNRIPLAGNNQFMPMAGIGFGERMTHWKKVDRIYGRLGGYFQYPYNTKWLPNLNLELGVSFKSKK